MWITAEVGERRLLQRDDDSRTEACAVLDPALERANGGDVVLADREEDDDTVAFDPRMKNSSETSGSVATC